MESYILESTIHVPSAVTALSLGPNDTFCAGTDDGAVRWYNLQSGKVSRAVKSLGDEIASIVWSFPKNAPACVWVASGCRVFSLPAESPKMILTAEDATNIITVGINASDMMNEARPTWKLNLSENGKYLAFSSDSGVVGTIDISSQKILRMKSSHTTVCGCVKFIPERPNELLSAGYDCALLHFDIAQGTILSRYDITGPPPSDNISLSPPFVLSISISKTRLIVASTADGRLWIGGGGEKRPSAPSQASKKKRSRKWEGLKQDQGLWVQAADGPIVSVVFKDPEQLIACTLLGIIVTYRVSRDDQGALQASKTWSGAVSSGMRVSSIAVNESLIAIGGVKKDGKGVVEIWRITQQAVPQSES
ncbi:WD40-repeat-containing domain protein [Lenzites betulinus]|nr:WD40-repeat-containing domain protein [Lenzites betulinus]